MTKTLLMAVAAIALGLTSPVWAQPLAQPPAWAAPGIVVAQDEVLSEVELRDALEVAGYTKIHVMRTDGDLYEMSAQKDNRPVLLRVNARTRRYSERPGD